MCTSALNYIRFNKCYWGNPNKSIVEQVVVLHYARHRGYAFFHGEVYGVYPIERQNNRK